MNIRMSAYILSLVLRVEAVFMVPPLCIALYNNERETALGFFLTIFLLTIICTFIKRPANTAIYAREAFYLAALVWVVISLFGALPFVISGGIPSFVDAFFETVSGFTTTGASVLSNVEGLSQGLLFWRSFTHWIGGMGVLVFVLILLSGPEGHMLHLMRAEATGPEIGKMVPRMADNAKILYLMYLGLTVLEIVFLLAGGMPLFDSLIHAFGTAGTGGFSNKNLSVGAYNSAYIEWVIGIFMLLFGVNFNIYYLLLLKKFLLVKKNTELKVYWLLALGGTAVIAINILETVGGSVGTAIRHSFFQVSSIITTTGFATVDFDSWPNFGRLIMLLLMVIGSCAGSTAGGIKVSRLAMLGKNSLRQVERFVHPNLVRPIRMDGRPVDNETVSAVVSFSAIYVGIITAVTVIIAAFGHDLMTSFSASVATISNIGPGLSLVGPAGNFGLFNPFLKILLSINMLVGRLEIFPVLILIYSPLMRLRKKFSGN